MTPDLTPEQIIDGDPEAHGHRAAADRSPVDRFAEFESIFQGNGESKPPKLILPDVPPADDRVGLAAWLTVTLSLDRAHPIIDADHQGQRGADGHVVLRRLDAPDLRFEPASALSSSRRLLPMLIPQLLPTDDEPFGFTDHHARRIAYVVQRLSGGAGRSSEAEETAGIVGAFMADAKPIEGLTTYGTRPQRYEAAAALQRPADARGGRYLVDVETGEAIVRVSDLQATARSYVGGSLARGWLDARMEDLGWRRITLDGHAEAGRSGRKTHHIRLDAYRGLLPSLEDADESVTTRKGGPDGR